VPTVAETTSGHHLIVLRGVAWSTVRRVVEVFVSFAAMLVLVRVIPPEEYGRAGAVVGVVTLLNAFSCSQFMAVALQLPDGAEPDWSLHWSAGFYIQLSVSAACQLVAGVCWLYPAYRQIAPLIHLAGIGILLDWPNWLGGLMLRRAMDFQRLEILNGVTTFVSLGVTLALGVSGGGAYAIVLGGNVARALPFGADLLIVRRWRPAPGWWRWPDWKAYRPALRFGFQQSGSALLHGARGALEAAVLPGLVGYGAIGLFNRAQALFATTVGRVGSILVETVYPLMPRYAANLEAYPRQATLFLQVVCLCAVPGAVYVGLEGAALSRLLYGLRWTAADPLIPPCALIGLGQVLLLTASGILLAANRLKTSFLLDLTAAVLSALVIGVAWTAGGLHAYAWAAAAGHLLAAAAALGLASPLLATGWARTSLLPPAVISAVGVILIMAIEPLWAPYPPLARLAASSALFALGAVLTLRGIFPALLTAVLSRVPGGQRVSGFLRLSPLATGHASP
jgi:O-antigen/teichoic acid export membrane protein